MGAVFFRVIRTDIIKYKRSLVPWITVFYPAITVGLITIITIGTKEKPDQPLFSFCRNLLLVSSFFLPFYLTLLVTQINFTENRIQGWKLLFAQPVPKYIFLLSKITMILLCCTLSYFFMNVFTLISAKVLGLYAKEAFFDDVSANYLPPMLKLLIVYLSASLMIAIQFFLSLRFKNFILPLGIGIAASILPIAIFITLGIAGILQGPGGLTNILRFDPYTLPYSFTFDFGALIDPRFLGVIPEGFVIASVSAAVLIYIFTYLDHTRRNTL
jgi:lantibiotic transport system permease protein